jgi:tRNA(Glu) U13 pseudouridine synthase TruD
LKISTKNKSRWIKTGSMSLAAGYNFTIKRKEFIDFDFKKVEGEDDMFELNFNLPAGEYAFVYIGTSAYSNNSIFSFSVN